VAVLNLVILPQDKAMDCVITEYSIRVELKSAEIRRIIP
jgi:hypothetical protein